MILVPHPFILHFGLVRSQARLCASHTPLPLWGRHWLRGNVDLHTKHPRGYLALGLAKLLVSLSPITKQTSLSFFPLPLIRKGAERVRPVFAITRVRANGVVKVA